MADLAANPVNQFSIGHVLKQTFSAFFRRITHFLPLGLLCSRISQMIGNFHPTSP